LLPQRYYRSVEELRWNDSTTVMTPHGDLLVRAIEVRHWGARIQRDTWRGYGGFVLEREGALARSTRPSCRSAPTTRGSAITARPSRR
jgi:hypothetical protein